MTNRVLQTLIFISFFCLMGLLFGCNSNKIVAPSIQYNQSVDFHIAKGAYLYWQPGDIHSSAAANAAAGDSSIEGAIAITNKKLPTCLQKKSLEE